MVGEACLPSNAYYPRTPDYTLCSGVHVCWSEHSDSSFVYGFMSLDYGFGTMTGTTLFHAKFMINAMVLILILLTFLSRIGMFLVEHTTVFINRNFFGWPECLVMLLTSILEINY